MDFKHQPVLLRECIEGLRVAPGGIYVDGTAGGGGHSAAVAGLLDTGRLVAIDRDPSAIRAAGERLSGFGQRVTLVQANFSEIPAVLDRLGIGSADGILLDLGVSSHQLDEAGRGFSYHQDAPLDMRMEQDGMSAYEVVNSYGADELTRIFREYGEERFARRIARGIEERRSNGAIRTTGELVEIIRGNIPAAARREGGHPAKRVFQAIRIEVNSELDSLRGCLAAAFERLRPGGRFAVISFHSLEDRIVKQSFAAFCAGCTCPPEFPVCVCGKQPRARLVNRKPITASPEELAQNSRSKPAKLRVLERI